MITKNMLLKLIALFFFLLAASGAPAPLGVNWTAWGLFFWLLSTMSA